MEFNSSIEQALSPARFSTYRHLAADDDHAWELYQWNGHLAAAFVGLLTDLEVTMRNTIDRQLTDYLGRTDWWAGDRLVLDDFTASTLSDVVQRHRKHLASGRIGPVKVIADLMLGTWVTLLSRGGTSVLGSPARHPSSTSQPSPRNQSNSCPGCAPTSPRSTESAPLSCTS